MRQHGASGPHEADQVDVQRALPHVEIGVEQRLVAPDVLGRKIRTDVEQSMDLAECVDRRADECPDGELVCQVETYRDRSTAVLRDLGRGGLSARELDIPY